MSNRVITLAPGRLFKNTLYSSRLQETFIEKYTKWVAQICQLTGPSEVLAAIGPCFPWPRPGGWGAGWKYFQFHKTLAAVSSAHSAITLEAGTGHTHGMLGFLYQLFLSPAWFQLLLQALLQSTGMYHPFSRVSFEEIIKLMVFCCPSAPVLRNTPFCLLLCGFALLVEDNT